MSLLPNDPTVQGKALFEGTQAPYTQDDAGDKKDPGGTYSHDAKAGSAHTFQSVVDWLLYINSILKGWTLTGIADGYVMRWVAGSASWVAGKIALASLANIAANKILGNATGSPAAPAEIDCTAAGRAILDDATAADQRTTLGAAASGAITGSGLTFSATDKLAGRSSSGGGAVEEISCTAAGRALLDDADAAAQRVTLATLKMYGSSTGVPTADGAGIYKELGDGKWYISLDGSSWEALT